MRDHPDARLLESFMRGEASAPERRSIVRHMLTGCLQCLAVTRPLWRLGPLLPEPGRPGKGTGGDSPEDRARAAEEQGVRRS